MSTANLVQALCHRHSQKLSENDRDGSDSQDRFCGTSAPATLCRQAPWRGDLYRQIVLPWDILSLMGIYVAGYCSQGLAWCVPTSRILHMRCIGYSSRLTLPQCEPARCAALVAAPEPALGVGALTSIPSRARSAALAGSATVPGGC